MKRNSKFLLVLTMMICAIGLSMVGCDDTTVEPPEVVADRVVGSIEGVVLDENTRSPLGDFYVVYWSNEKERDSVMTEDDGAFIIDDELSSGSYTILVNDPEEGYAVGYYVVYIPTVKEVKGDIDVNPAGELHYRASFFDDCEGDNCLGSILLFNLCATVRGQLWSALPSGVAPKGDDGDLALDGPLSPISGVRVIVTYPADCGVVPLIWPTETDGGGFYTFTGLPAYDGEISLTIPPFAFGDSSYQQFDTTIYLINCETIGVPDVYGIVDCRSLPTVLSYNFPSELDFDYYSNLVLEFSEPMNTNSFSFALVDVTADPNETVSGTFTWNTATATESADSILTFDPLMTLKTYNEYALVIYNAFSKSGCQLGSQYDSLPFMTADGIALFANSAETAPDDFTDFQIEDDIELEFTMVPVIDPIYGTLTLTDVTTGTDYPVAFDSSVSGNTLIIDPRDDLELSHKYKVCYKMFSSIPGDYVEGCFFFWTEIDPNPPLAVTGWQSDEASGWRADWNTTEISFKWDKVDRAQYYLIYAYDNANENPNTDFIRIDSIRSADYLQFQVQDVDIPIQFDRYKDDFYGIGNDPVHTPFTDGTHMWFMIRAGNAAGLSPHSDTLEFWDTTPPGGGDDEYSGNDDLDVYVTYGSADNVMGSSTATVWLNLDDDLEYMRRTSNPTFNFVEAGGDETYSVPNGNGFWAWDNDSRHNDYEGQQATNAYFTVPAGECGAGDTLYLTFYDNSGNDTTVQFRVAPYIEYSSPIAGDDFEADDDDEIDWVIWSAYNANPPHTFGYLDYYLTLDGGATFVDTLDENEFGPGSGSEDVELSSQWMSDGNARVLLMDEDGGCTWYSDYFTVNGILLTGPDSATYYEMDPIYDAEGTDSTVIPMTWDYVGIDSVGIWYEVDGGASKIGNNWELYDSVANTGSYDFYAPDLGDDYDCRVAVADFDADYMPIDSITWDFVVVNDYVNFIDPSAAEDVPGGVDYDIYWELVGEVTQMVIIELSLDGNVDSLYTPLATTENDSLYTWAVPATTPSTNAYLRFRDVNDSNTLDFVGPFNITGLTVTAPIGGGEWLVGSAQNITWDCADPVAVGDVHIWYSNNGFTAPGDSVEITGGTTTNDGTYNWTVDSPPSATTSLRIWNDAGTVFATSDVFTVCGVTVTQPDGGDTWAVGSSVTINWLTGCASILTVDIAYSVNSGANWTDIVLDEANDGSFTWNVVDNVTADGTAMVRIRDNATTLGADASNATFDIAGIVITQPAGGADWANGSTHNIVWTEVSTIGDNLEIHYSLDGSDGTYFPVPGASNVPVGTGGTFAWQLNAQTDANLATSADCWVRVRENGSGTIWDKSPAAFIISNNAPVADANSNTVDLSDVVADISWDGEVTDADAGVLPTLSWAWVGATPAGAFTAVNNGDGTMTFTYTYNAADDTNTYTLELTGDDGLATHANTVDLVVNPTP